MLFKRMNGKSWKGERITRFKLVKTGKNWMRVACSNITFFQRRGKEGAPPLSFSRSSQLALTKGLIATGALLGAVSLAQPTFADQEDKQSFGSELDSEIGLIGKDSLVLGIAGNSLTSEKINSLTSQESFSSSVGTPVSEITSMASSEASTSINSTSLSELVLTEPSFIQLDQQEERLYKLAQDIYRYIDQAKALEDGKETVFLGKQALDAIRHQLANPSAEGNQVVDQAKTARNRLINLVLRATSGKRDSRNGNAIGSDQMLRAPFVMSGPGNNHLITAYNSDPVRLQYLVRERNGGVILTFMGYAPNSERVDGVLVPNATLKTPFAPMLIEGKVGDTEVVEPGKTYTITVRFTNAHNQFIDRSFRIKVLPQNDGIRNPIVAVKSNTQVSDLSQLTDAEKEQVWEKFKAVNPRLISSKDFKSYSVSATGEVTVVFKDNTTNTVTVPLTEDPRIRSLSLSVSSSLSEVESTSRLGSESKEISELKSLSEGFSDSLSNSSAISASVGLSNSVSISESEEESISFSEEASSSLSESVSEFQSVSASESEESSISLSESASGSVSETQSVSTSESEESSTSLSESASGSVSEFQSVSASESEEASTSLSESVSESVSETQSVSTSESEEASTSLSESVSGSVSETQSVSTSESEESSTSLSESVSETQSVSASESEESSTSLSESVSESVSETQSVSASESEESSISLSESVSGSVSETQSVSASESEAASTSQSESSSESVSETQSVSASESEETSISLSESASGSVSEFQSVSASESEESSISLSESSSESVSETQSVSASESEAASTSLSESASESLSESVLISQTVTISLSESRSQSSLSSHSISTSGLASISALPSQKEFTDPSTSLISSESMLSSQKDSQSKVTLPETGVSPSKGLYLAGLTTLFAGLTSLGHRKKEEK